MKYLILVGDGMADRPVTALGGKTPLEAARILHADRIALKGITGSVRTIPEGFDPGSDVANLSLLGFDPRVYYTGRAPLEAASLGVKLESEDMAFRCNLVTLRATEETLLMEDYSAGHIPTAQAQELIGALDHEVASFRDWGFGIADCGFEIRNPKSEIRNIGVAFYPGTSYRHLMVWRGARERCRDLVLTPPHDITGLDIGPYLPRGGESGMLLRLMTDSQMILKRHPINVRREEEGFRPANSPWFWGQGWRPQLPSFMDKYGLRGSMISAVDLLKGIGVYLGLEVIRVPGATGYLDTNYRGKVEAAIACFQEKDLVFLHVEAPDEASHEGNREKKLQALEDFDAQVVGPAVEAMEQFGSYRVLLVTDHSTPVEMKTHAIGAVPFAVCGTGLEPDGAAEYDESLLKKGSRHFETGPDLMDFFLRSGQVEEWL